MARQRQSPAVKKGWRGNTLNAAELAAAERNNRFVEQADALLGMMPERVRNQPFARDIADRVVDVRNLPSNPRAQLAAAGLGVAGLGASALGAYADLREEYLPSGPLDVAGRMVNNLMPGSSAPVGADPLAQARNNVAAAAALVGTEEMVGALAADQINEMRSIGRASMISTDYGDLDTVQQMIDKRADDLMAEHITYKDGRTGPMPYDQAIRLATEAVAMELRAGQVY